MSNVLSILHISDLHFSEAASHKQRLLIEPFFNDLSSLISQQPKPDLIIFSGDLVQNPDEEDIYYRFHVIDRLLKHCGLPEDRIVFCPGNHDVSFESLGKNTLLYNSVQNINKDQSQVELLYSKGKIHEYLSSTNQRFFEFCSFLQHGWDDPFAYVRNIDDLRTSIIAFNTTLSCSLEGSAADRGRLVLPVSALEKALEATRYPDAMVVTGHHPISDLTEPSARLLQHFIDQHADVHLFGHLHDARPVLQTSSARNTLSLQSGALYTSGSEGKVYYLLQHHRPSRERRVFVRSYMENRGVFDAGTNIAPKGIFPPDSSDESWRALLPRIDMHALREWLADVGARAVISEFGRGFADLSLNDTYVFPPLARTKEADPSEDDPEALDELWDLQDLLNKPENVVVFVPDEFGASSLLAYTAIQACMPSTSTKSAQIPLLIDLRTVKAYEASALRALKQAHPEIDHADFGWKPTQYTQPYLVLIDNFDPGSQPHKEAIRSLHACLPRARYVVCAKTRAVATTSISIDLELPFSHVKLMLMPFNRQRVRSLVRKWSLPPLFTENYVVEQIGVRFRSLSIPLSGPHISMFLMVLAAQKGFSPLNASTVIENFVEALLEKPSVEKFFRRGMDFRETADLLGFLAEELVRDATSSKPKNELIGAITHYYDRIGIKRDPVNILNDFILQKVFEEIDGTVSFKYNVLFSYFIAYRMKGNLDFRRFILDFERFTDHVHEIDLYCGLSRSDSETIDLISDHYKKLVNELEDEVIALSDPSFLDNRILPYDDDFDEFVDRFTKTIVGESHPGEHDRIVEPSVSRDQFRQNLQRRTVHNSLFRWILGLRAYSVCLKNLESITKEQKTEHLRVIMDGWGRLTALGVTILGLCFENKVVDLPGLKFRFDLVAKLDGKVMRSLLIAVPRFVATFLRSDLGSEKLDQQLRDPELGKVGAIDLLRTGLMAYLKLPGFLRTTRDFLSRNKQVDFLTQAMSSKLRDVYVRYGFTKDEESEFRQVIAELDADMRGLSGFARDRHIAAFYNECNDVNCLRTFVHKSTVPCPPCLWRGFLNIILDLICI